MAQHYGFGDAAHAMVALWPGGACSFTRPVAMSAWLIDTRPGLRVLLQYES